MAPKEKKERADQELDVLFRRHACSNLLSCATTLESLSKLVHHLLVRWLSISKGNNIYFYLCIRTLCWGYHEMVQVQSLPRMIVTDEIGKQVKFSLEATLSAQHNASLGVYDASAASSRKARVLAEHAFFHPSIMSVSYSPIEHYLAIFMPFFAPVVLLVFLAAGKELKRYIGGCEQNIYHLLLAKTRDILPFRILRPHFRWHPY